MCLCVSVCLRVCVSVFVHILSCFDGGTTQICRCFGASASGTLMCWGGRKRYTKETEKGEEERRKPEHMMSQTKTQLTSLTHSTLCLPPPLLLSLSPPHSPLLSLLSLLSLSLSLSLLSLFSLSLSLLSPSRSRSLSLSLSLVLSQVDAKRKGVKLAAHYCKFVDLISEFSQTYPRLAQLNGGGGASLSNGGGSASLHKSKNKILNNNNIIISILLF